MGHLEEAAVWRFDWRARRFDWGFDWDGGTAQAGCEVWHRTVAKRTRTRTRTRKKQLCLSQNL